MVHSLYREHQANFYDYQNQYADVNLTTHNLENIYTVQNNWFKLAPKPVLLSEFLSHLKSLPATEKQRSLVWDSFNQNYPRVLLPKLTSLEEEIVKIARDMKRAGVYYFAPLIIYSKLQANNGVSDKEFRDAIRKLVFQDFIFFQHRVSGVLEFNLN